MQGTLNLFVLALTACAFIGLARAPDGPNPLVGLFFSTILMSISVVLLVCSDFVD